MGIRLQRGSVIRRVHPPGAPNECEYHWSSARPDLTHLERALLEAGPCPMTLQAESADACSRRLARRSLLLPSLVLGALASQGASAVVDAQTDILDLEEAVSLILRNGNPDFLAAVRSAGGGAFLYRGEDLGSSLAARLVPQPDLLLPETYGSQDAFQYFRGLDQTLQSLGGQAAARPSNGHIGVARQEAAATWGQPVSIWPLGQGTLRYAWPASGGKDFWPESMEREKAASRRYRVDEGLSEALTLGREVLFKSSLGFVAIRASENPAVRRGLALEPPCS